MKTETFPLANDAFSLLQKNVAEILNNIFIQTSAGPTVSE